MTLWPWRRRVLAIQPLFQLGQVLVSPPARKALCEWQVNLGDLLARHQRGDWGQVDEIDAKQNELGLRMPMRIRSIYYLPFAGESDSGTASPPSSDDEIWLITSADRARTQILLPSEIFNAADQESI